VQSGELARLVGVSTDTMNDWGLFPSHQELTGDTETTLPIH
jgi:hypothetical protein